MLDIITDVIDGHTWDYLLSVCPQLQVDSGYEDYTQEVRQLASFQMRGEVLVLDITAFDLEDRQRVKAGLAAYGLSWSLDRVLREVRS